MSSDTNYAYHMQINCKYVIYGSGAEWSELIYWDVLEKDNVHFMNSRIPNNKSRWLTKLCKLHYIEKFDNIPIITKNRRIWYRTFVNNKFLSNSNNIIFIFQDWNALAYDNAFHTFLRNEYPNAKLVFMYTNLVNKSGANKKSYVKNLKEEYDMIITYDRQDALKYNYELHPYLYSKYSLYSNTNKQGSDIFFVGNAKARLDTIHMLYKHLTEKGLKCDFYVFGVDDKHKLYNSDIKYNRWISYRKILELIQESRCILEIVQEGASGSTIRAFEAVLYNKKLITNNKSISQEPFYSNKYIQIMDDIEDINIDFITSTDTVSYDEKFVEMFSPKRLFEKLYYKLYK
ncbi:MAG TPA: hypothetical protein VEF53_08150 [Patescibacteria group bacterium]|nr:hypothetical protein [Patescibacteria group bacterium]